MSRSPRERHPNLNEYRDGGMGGDAEHSVVGFVRTERLRAMPGNPTTEEGVERHREALRSGEGFKNPAMLMFNPKTKQAFVGEGNHRVEAAWRAGDEYVPARVVRAHFDEGYAARNGGRAVTLDPKPYHVDGQGQEYWPSDIHPMHLFPEHDVWRDRRGE